MVEGEWGYPSFQEYRIGREDILLAFSRIWGYDGTLW